MAKIMPTYIELEKVRIAYDSQSHSMKLTSKDPDMPQSAKGFTLNLNAGTNAGRAAAEMLRNAGLMPEDGSLPAASPYYRHSGDVWNSIPVGLSYDHKPVRLELDFDRPHLLLLGNPGTGKTHFIENVQKYLSTFGDDVTVRHIGFDKQDRVASRAKTMGALKSRAISPTHKEVLIVDGILDDIDSLRDPWGRRADYIIAEDLASEFAELMRDARSRGYYVIATTQGRDREELSSLSMKFSNSMILGKMDRHAVSIIQTSPDAVYHDYSTTGGGFLSAETREAVQVYSRI